LLDAALFGIILIPVAISVVCKFALKMDISWLEWTTQVLVGTLCLFLIWGLGSMTTTGDKEILNGAVTGKEAIRFSCPTNTSNPCRNGYDCNCVTICTPTYDSKGQISGQSCTTTCDRCYVYPWEQNWMVYSDVKGREFEIDRVDRQGADQPRRWSIVQPGDPVSIPNKYTNWVKASARTLFRDGDQGLETYAALLPQYPVIYDYYRVDRFIPTNVQVTKATYNSWNLALSNALRTLGPKKQMNAIIVTVEGAPRDYAFTLRRHWEGFKKNDAVIVIGLKNGSVQWAEVMSWSKNSIFDVEVRNMTMNYIGTDFNTIDPVAFMARYDEISMRNFLRRPMEEFEYLKGDIPPPNWLVILSIVLALIFGVGTSYLFSVVDLDAAIRNMINRNRYRY
jgi:hypothetical protein